MTEGEGTAKRHVTGLAHWLWRYVLQEGDVRRLAATTLCLAVLLLLIYVTNRNEPGSVVVLERIELSLVFLYGVLTLIFWARAKLPRKESPGRKSVQP
jgi:energy-coupling factor transporter transmembrane protein EcfT